MAEAVADAAESAGAMAYGSALHLLLEHLPELPETERAAAAARLVPDPALRDQAFAQAAGLMAADHLGAVFRPGPGARVMREVALAAPGPGGVPLMGIIDRLILTEGRALAIDYKTNRLVPPSAAEVPGGLVRQMAAYRHALGAILPGRAVEVAILWTATGRMMTLDPATLDRAAAEVGPQHAIPRHGDVARRAHEPRQQVLGLQLHVHHAPRRKHRLRAHQKRLQHRPAARCTNLLRTARSCRRRRSLHSRRCCRICSAPGSGRSSSRSRASLRSG
jgi:hypothetical protein